ncbi:MAG: tetratricopeptide repeat protein [Bacteroidia bacterium]|nr:tetratricopeptide repeat protein [Bacteroidia bacterium]
MISLAPKSGGAPSSSESLDLIKKIWEDGEGRAVQLGFDWEEQLLVDDNIPARKVPIVHIDCSQVRGDDFTFHTQNNQTKLTNAQLAKKLAKLPGFQALVLSNVNDQAVVNVFLKNKVPLIFAFNEALEPQQNLPLFYNSLLAGESLQETFVKLAEEQKLPICYQEFSIDPIQKALKWDERKLGENPDWTNGLLVRRLDKHRLIWRLKNPEFIKKDAYGIKSLSEVVADLSHYSPSLLKERQPKQEETAVTPKENAPIPNPVVEEKVLNKLDPVKTETVPPVKEEAQESLVVPEKIEPVFPKETPLPKTVETTPIQQEPETEIIPTPLPAIDKKEELKQDDNKPTEDLKPEPFVEEVSLSSKEEPIVSINGLDKHNGHNGKPDNSPKEETPVEEKALNIEAKAPEEEKDTKLVLPKTEVPVLSIPEEKKEAEKVISIEPIARVERDTTPKEPIKESPESKGLFKNIPQTRPENKVRRSPKIRKSAHEDLITPNTSFIPPEEKKQDLVSKNRPKEEKPKEKNTILAFNKAANGQKEVKPVENKITKNGSQETTAKKTEEKSSRSRPNRQRVNKEKPQAVANPVKGPKHKRRRRMMFGLGAIGGIILLGAAWIGLQNSGNNTTSAGVPPCPFPSDEGEYKILVTPFHKEGNCGVQKEEFVTDVIKTIQKIKKKDDLRISVRYQADVCLEDDQNLDALVDNCHADLVLGGIWRQGVSEAETHLQMSYVLAKGSEEEVLVEGKGIRKEIHGTETLPASAILLEDVKNFVYWAAAMRAMKRGYYDEAVSALEKIEASRPELQSLIVLMMTKSLVKGGHFQQAIAYFDQLIDEEPTNEKFYLERGYIRSKMGWPQKALEDFDVVMSLSPENTQAPIYRSKTLSEMGRYSEALRDIEKLIEKFDQLPELYMTRGKIYQEMDKLRDAQLDYEKAISLDPNNANAYVGRANILRAKGDIEGAKGAINQALSHEASHPEANIFAAKLLEEQGRKSEALDELEIVISRYPSPEAYFMRGRLNEDAGMGAKALKDYEAASKADASNINSWIAIGRINLDQGKTQKALNAYQRAIDLRSGQADLFCLRGEVYTKLKRYNEAETDYNRALEIAPNSTKALNGRSLLYLTQKEYSKALIDADKASSIKSNDPNTLIVRARIYTAQKDFDKAFSDFNKVTKLDPYYSDAYYYQGIANMQAGNPSQAEKDFDKAVSLGGAQLDAFLFLGDASLESGKISEALNRFNEAIDYAPESPEPYRHRAEYYIYQNDITKALEDYDKLIELQGEATAEDYLKRGKLYLLNNSRTQALVDFNQAILLSPKWIEGYCTRGDLYKRMGRAKKALEDYNKATEADPQSPLPYLRKADLFMQLEDEAQAFESAEVAINLSPKNADAYNKRGELYVLMEKPDKALEDFQKALSLDPNNAKVYTNLGNEAKKSGRLKQAFGYFSQAIRLNPRQADALYQRGFLKYLDKNYPSAIIDLETSLKADPQNGLAYGTLAKIYASKRDENKMYYYLEQALQHKYPAIELSFDPVFKNYSEDVRMKDLIASHPQ